MRLTVEVKQEHIDRGRRGNAEYCPIACALREMKYRDIDVDTAVYFTDKNYEYYGYSPKRVIKFMITFDSKGKSAVKPFKFSINLAKEEKNN